MMKTVVILLVALTGLSHQVPLDGDVLETNVVVEVTKVVEVATTTVQPEVVTPELTPFGDCPPEDVEFPTYLSDMKNCSVFYQCAHGVPFRMECRFPLEFNPVLKVCDYPFESGCLLKQVVNEVAEAAHDVVEAAHDAAADVVEAAKTAHDVAEAEDHPEYGN